MPLEPASSRPARRQLEGVVRIRCEGRRGIHTGFLRDLSSAGMFVRILDPELPGQHLDFDLDLALDGQRRRVSGRGEVVWCRAGYEGPARPPGMGIRFLGLAAGSREVLQGTLGDSEFEPSLHDPLVPPPGAWPPALREPADGANRSGSRMRRGVLGAVGVLAAGVALAVILGPSPRTPTEESGSVVRAAPRVEPLVEESPPPPAPAAEPEWLEVAETSVVAELPVTAAQPEPLAAMSRVTAIHWQATAEGTRVTIEGDGYLDRARVHSSGISGEAPRRVVRLQGVGGAATRLEAGTPELLRVRVGHHEARGGELHVVLDLAAPGVLTEPVEPFDGGLHVVLRSASGSTPHDVAADLQPDG